MMLGKAVFLLTFGKRQGPLKKIIIAIDGHSSCGKSSLAKALGEAIDYTYISSGDMYRAVTLYFLRNKVNINNPEAVAEALKNIQLEFKRIDGQNRIFLNGEDVSEEIRSMPVAEWVSPVAAIPAVRREMVRQQRLMGEQKGIVMDGRDIGTVVFPNAELKIFLTADLEERARRRYKELLENGYDVEFEDVLQNLEERDRIDSTRADSPLTVADDARILDNTNLNREQSLAKALEMYRETLAALEAQKEA